MFLVKKYIILIYFLCVCLFTNLLYGQDIRENSPILIISSYNPETFQTSSNISEFMDEYKLLEGTSPVIIENMNCKSFSEALHWKKHMAEILDKYQGSKSPSLIILLGQEAWTSYLSQDDILERHTPTLCGMVSRNAILLPDTVADLRTWKPESVDFEEKFGQEIPIAGYAYDYDIEANIRLIKKLYPATRHVAFISDNSYGGVTMQAFVRQEMLKFPDVNLILLDGRQHTIYTMVDQIAQLPDNTVILVGTWRIDRNEGYFMRNSTYTIMSANPRMPAFSLSSIGLGHWVIGGCSPQYRSVGKDLAQQAIQIQKKQFKAPGLILISNEYVFDSKKITEFGIDEKLLPPHALMVNKEQTFFEKYKLEIIGLASVFICLVGGLVISLYYFFRVKKLKDELVISEAELVAAKEKAEESDRLKSAFLANMSHEIRTPLNAIVGFSNVLVSGDCSLEEQKEFVEVIQTNSDLLLRLINDILDISRLETGKLKFTFEQCDITALCQKVLATTSYSKQPGVEYVFEPCADSFFLETDVQRLQQVLINLMSNANKFTTEGTITLAFHEDEKKEFLVFSVTDTGCGIPVEKQNKVFERFEKLNEYAQGTGLGLAICKITVGILGGEIWVDRNYTGGARFVFTHPVQGIR